MVDEQAGAEATDSPERHVTIADVRGLLRLAAHATTGVTHIVEGVHRAVWDAIGLGGGKTPGRTNGITGLVYRSVRGVAGISGAGADVTLAGLTSLMESAQKDAAESDKRIAMLSAINGVLGDHLIADANPLALNMSMRYQGLPLTWRDLPPMGTITGNVLLLIHGLCMNDLQWRGESDGVVVDHGAALASALGYTPVHLRYNSGLHISHNGRELAAQLEQLVTHWPAPIREISVLAHSMGGLLIRSALHYARLDDMRWPDQLKKIVFLGTPHHGAPLEQIGAWADAALAASPFTAPFTRLGRVRSAGITDLRYGHLVDEDWRGRDRFQRHPDTRQIVPLPDDAACFTLAATTCARSGPLADRLIGDGLVPLRSALGQHDEAGRSLSFAAGSQSTFFGMHHIELLRSPAVTQQLVHWLSPPA